MNTARQTRTDSDVDCKKRIIVFSICLVVSLILAVAAYQVECYAVRGRASISALRSIGCLLFISVPFCILPADGFWQMESPRSLIKVSMAS